MKNVDPVSLITTTFPIHLNNHSMIKIHTSFHVRNNSFIFSSLNAEFNVTAKRNETNKQNIVNGRSIAFICYRNENLEWASFLIISRMKSMKPSPSRRGRLRCERNYIIISRWWRKREREREKWKFASKGIYSWMNTFE